MKRKGAGGDGRTTTTIAIEVKEPEHLDLIRQIVSDMIGELCWEARLGNGDELKLEIGDRVQIDHRIRASGSWSFGSRGTDWQLTNGEGEVVVADTSVESYTPEEIEQKIQVIANTRIIAFEPLYPNLGLTITFDNHSQLTILPTVEDDDYNLSYWELFTPSGILKVGPKSTYTYMSSKK